MKKSLFIEASDKLRLQIEAELTENSSDWTLPTMRTLSEAYGISLFTMKKAVDLLAEQGFVSSRQGKGITVNRQRVVKSLEKKGFYKIGIVFHDNYSPDGEMISEIVSGVCAAASGENILLQMMPMPSVDENLEEINLTLERNKPDGLILASRLPVTVVAKFIEKKIPMVWVDDYLRHENIPAILIDRESLFDTVLTRASEIGNTISYISPYSNNNFKNEFKIKCKNKDLEVYNFLVGGGNFSEAAAKDFGKESIDKIENSLSDVIFCSGEFTTHGVIQALLKRGVNIGDEVKIISICERKGAELRFSIPMDIVFYSKSALASKAFSVLMRILEKEKLSNTFEYVIPKLVSIGYSN
jgi:DNA-binding LacI/PurR family transcriptional regulator